MPNSSFKENKQVKLVLEEDLSIGDESGKTEYTFSKIMPIRKDQITIAVDKNERIYVLDYEQCHINIFDKNGAHIKTFGRKGQGPGEIEFPLSLSITNNDEILIEDVRARRLHFFTLNGEYRCSVSTAKGFRMLKFRANSTGDLVGLNISNRTNDILYELCLFDKKLNLIRTIGSYRYPVSVSSMNVFTPTLQYTLYPDDSILYAFPDVYELKIIDIEGREVKKITKEFIPIEVTAEEQESIKKSFPPDAKLQFPKYHNAFRYFTVDEEGRIFVQTWETTKNGKSYYHDVFDRKGNYLAKIPLEIHPIFWKKNKLYTIVENESGSQIVKRYRVDWQKY